MSEKSNCEMGGPHHPDSGSTVAAQSEARHLRADKRGGLIRGKRFSD